MVALVDGAGGTEVRPLQNPDFPESETAAFSQSRGTKILVKDLKNPNVRQGAIATSPPILPASSDLDLTSQSNQLD